MAEDPQLYSWIHRDDAGVARAVLSPEHPGYGDPIYQAERDAIARATIGCREGQTPPIVDYGPAAIQCWRHVSQVLAASHEQYAHEEILYAASRFSLPVERVPQLAAVSARLTELTGFRFAPAPGVVAAEDFFSGLAARTFYATQYVRHQSQPLYSPEPDMVHEVIGHGTMLASPRFAGLYELMGRAAQRVADEDVLRTLSAVFWFTLEYGVIRERGELFAFGASLLSSYGELEAFRDAEVKRLDVTAMAAEEYVISRYQPTLYYADSLEHLEAFLTQFCASIAN